MFLLKGKKKGIGNILNGGTQKENKGDFQTQFLLPCL